MNFRRPAIWLINVCATIIGGWYLNLLVDRLPFNMPYPVDMGIRGFLHLIGHDELSNPDDMEVLAGGLYLVVCLLIVGVLVWAVNRALRRRTDRGVAGH